jgi:hypothetical protein
MAKDKKSFLIYCDLIHTVKKLSKEDAGELFMHMLEYTNDLNPETENAIVDIVFEPIKQQLKRDLKAYEKSLDDRSYNGRLGNLKRWNLDLYNLVLTEVNTLEEAEKIAISRKASLPDSSLSPTIANIAVNDTVNVTVNDTVKETIKTKDEAEIIYFSFDDFWNIYPTKSGKVKAKESFDKIPKSDLETLETHLNHFVNNKPFKEYSYPHATTYLNQKRYKDEIIINQQKTLNNGTSIIDSEEFKQLTQAIRNSGERR